MQAGIYQHYKGGFYQVLGVAADATTEATIAYGREGRLNGPKDLDKPERLMVVYVSLTGIDLPGPRMRVRDIREFCEWVIWPDEVRRPRFCYLGDTIR